MWKTALKAVTRMMAGPATTSQPLRPVVAVVGTTGVGKSQLAISLAQSLATLPSHCPQNGKVLSADSMQLYKGLDVITNKVTDEEKGGIEHWGLDVVKPGQGGSWEVGKWCAEASKEVESTPPSTLPIICGGTHYFIQHFLFPPEELSFDRPSAQQQLRESDPLAIRWTPSRPCPSVPKNMDTELRALLNTFWKLDAVYPTPKGAAESSGASQSAQGRSMSRPVAGDEHQLLSMWRVLDAVDPKEAARWHWKDGRKVRRALERWWERGGGEVEPSPGDDATKPGRQARFRTLIFWVYEPINLLGPRLDSRVDKMVANGLLDEIQELREIARRMYGSEEATDHSEGIFQSIGYKEFAGLPLPVEDMSSSTQFDAMVSRTKMSTRQYGKSQIKWIRKQLLPAARDARVLGGDVHVYVVPGGAGGESISRDILKAFLEREKLPDPTTVGHREAGDLLKVLSNATDKVADTAERQVLNARKICETCSTDNQPFSVRHQDWEEHLRSKVHKRRAKFSTISREEWIAAQRAKGLKQKAERERLRQEHPPPEKSC